MAITFSDLKTEIVRLGGLNATNDDSSAIAWGKGGLRMISRAGAWPWLRRTLSITLVADQYAYAIEDIASDLWRIDTKSLRYGNEFLKWAGIEYIDRKLGPSWKDASAASGTPEHILRFGVELWLAGKPSESFVDNNATISGYGWRFENYEEDEDINGGNLFIPEVFTECAVDAALAYGWYEEDDPRAQEKMSTFRQVHLPDMMGAKLDVGADDRMAPPEWSYYNYEDVDNYGDGY